jgi:hypothetical protein
VLWWDNGCSSAAAVTVNVTGFGLVVVGSIHAVCGNFDGIKLHNYYFNPFFDPMDGLCNHNILV